MNTIFGGCFFHPPSLFGSHYIPGGDGPCQSGAWDLHAYIMWSNSRLKCHFLSRHKLFSIHIIMQVKVILAVMKQLKQLQTKPRKNSEAPALLTCFANEASVGGSNPVGASEFFWAFVAAALHAQYLWESLARRITWSKQSDGVVFVEARSAESHRSTDVTQISCRRWAGGKRMCKIV